MKASKNSKSSNSTKTTSKTKLKIAIVSFGFVEHSTNLADALAKRGNDVTLFIPEKFRKNVEGFVKKANVEFLRSYKHGFWNPLNLSRAFRLTRRLRRLAPDAVIIESGEPWLCFFLSFVPQPVVLDLHDPVLHSGEEKIQTRVMQGATLRFAKTVIVHGKTLKKEFLVARPDFASADVFVLLRGPYGNYSRWAKPGVCEENDGNTVLFFGRIKRYKGLQYLAEAAPAIKRAVPNARIIVAGKGDSVDKEFFERAGIVARNEFIRDEDVAELFQRSAVVVLPYTDATQSAVALIAFAFDKPVVATRVGGLPEVVFDGETGILVPPRDSKALCNAIINILKNKELRARMKREIKRRYAGWWDESATQAEAACVAAAEKICGK